MLLTEDRRGGDCSSSLRRWYCLYHKDACTVLDRDRSSQSRLFQFKDGGSCFLRIQTNGSYRRHTQRPGWYCWPLLLLLPPKFSTREVDFLSGVPGGIHKIVCWSCFRLNCWQTFDSQNKRYLRRSSALPEFCRSCRRWSWQVLPDQLFCCLKIILDLQGSWSQHLDLKLFGINR